jgi:hypothetical protein
MDCSIPVGLTGSEGAANDDQAQSWVHKPSWEAFFPHQSTLPFARRTTSRYPGAQPWITT